MAVLPEWLGLGRVSMMLGLVSGTVLGFGPVAACREGPEWVLVVGDGSASGRDRAVEYELARVLGGLVDGQGSALVWRLLG